MKKLTVIVGSTRPGRVGLPIGQWFFEYNFQRAPVAASAGRLISALATG